jgi:CO/xanthine dehydrogenase Mo-binding subunit
LRADGTGLVRVGCTDPSLRLDSVVRAVGACSPGVDVEVTDVVGPPVSTSLRGAGWAEVLAARTALAAPPAPTGCGGAEVTVPGAGRARVALDLRDGPRGRMEIDVWAGEPLCPVTLRSYAFGAAHQALGMVWSEGIAVDPVGEPVDLTIRSFGILAARDVPDIAVRLHEDDRWPVNGSDAVFVATLAAAWIAEGLPPRWPTRRDTVRAPRRDVAPSQS